LRGKKKRLKVEVKIKAVSENGVTFRSRVTVTVLMKARRCHSPLISRLDSAVLQVFGGLIDRKRHFA